MPSSRSAYFLAALLLCVAGCDGQPDPVLASFVNQEFSTNRLVFYSSGKFEHYAADGDGLLQTRPSFVGAFKATASNYVVQINKGVFDAASIPRERVYRILNHDGVQYLFNERGPELRNFDKTKDGRELRHAWRREGR